MSEPERLRAVDSADDVSKVAHHLQTAPIPVTVVRARRHQANGSNGAPVQLELPRSASGRPPSGLEDHQRVFPAPGSSGVPLGSKVTAEHRRAALVTAAGVLLMLAAGAGLGSLYHVLRPPRSSATIGILVTSSTASLTDPGADPAPEQRDVTTRVDLLSSALVADRAERQVGRLLPHLAVTSRSDSDIVVAEVSSQDTKSAAIAVNAYVAAYEDLLGAQQKTALTSEQDRLRTLYAGYRKQVRALDAQLDGASDTRRQLLLTSQQPRRLTLASSMDDAGTRLSRLGELLDSLPATTKRLDTTPVTKVAPDSAVADVGTGVVLGVLASGVFLYRRFRPRFGQP